MADIKSTDSNNSPEAVKNYADGWDRIFGAHPCEMCGYKAKPGEKHCESCTNIRIVGQMVKDA